MVFGQQKPKFGNPFMKRRNRSFGFGFGFWTLALVFGFGFYETGPWAYLWPPDCNAISEFAAMTIIKIVVMLRRRFSETFFIFLKHKDLCHRETTATKCHQCNDAVFKNH